MFMQFQVKTKLKGHQKKITGLAFSQSLNVLVSSGADAQVCRINNCYSLGLCFGMYFLQLVSYSMCFLMLPSTSALITLPPMQWSPRDALPAPISTAVYSCDGLLVYAGFVDGAVGVFESDSLRLRCRIAPTAYISPSIARYEIFTESCIIVAYISL
ncbi:hypothetical protein GW17_00019249 [Ensete ventricosum]|nr:hypothetical protein GW17_00019249 [Ensete ventricosum]